MFMVASVWAIEAVKSNQLPVKVPRA
jgi:hypothetical protein